MVVWTLANFLAWKSCGRHHLILPTVSWLHFRSLALCYLQLSTWLLYEKFTLVSRAAWEALHFKWNFWILKYPVALGFNPIGLQTGYSGELIELQDGMVRYTLWLPTQGDPHLKSIKRKQISIHSVFAYLGQGLSFASFCWAGIYKHEQFEFEKINENLPTRDRSEKTRKLPFHFLLLYHLLH